MWSLWFPYHNCTIKYAYVFIDPNFTQYGEYHESEDTTYGYFKQELPKNSYQNHPETIPEMTNYQKKIMVWYH